MLPVVRLSSSWPKLHKIELDEKEMFDHSISAVKQLNEIASKFEAE